MVSFELQVIPEVRHSDQVCLHCQELRRTAVFVIRVRCGSHRQEREDRAFICRTCLEENLDFEDGGLYVQLCPDCARLMRRYRPSTEVPNFMPEDL